MTPAVGETVIHWQHGEGTVTEVIAPDFVRVLFPEDERKPGTEFNISTENLVRPDGTPFVSWDRRISG